MIFDVRRALSGLAFVFLFTVPWGCDRLHEPAICNGLDSAVELRVDWEDGRTSSGTVPAHDVVHVGRVDSRVSKVTALKDGAIFATVSGTQIEQLAGETDEDVAGVIIEDGGVRALTETDLKRFCAK